MSARNSSIQEYSVSYEDGKIASYKEFRWGRGFGYDDSEGLQIEYDVKSLSLYDAETKDGNYVDELGGVQSELDKYADTTQTLGLRTINEIKCSYADELVLPESVEKIGDEAFSGCENLKSITFSSNMTKISANACKGCEKLKEVILPEGITEIEESAFEGCTALETITLPSTVTVIGEKAFYNCTSLRSVITSKTVENVGEGAFGNCDALTDAASELLTEKEYCEAPELDFENPTEPFRQIFIQSPELYTSGALGKPVRSKTMFFTWDEEKEAIKLELIGREFFDQDIKALLLSVFPDADRAAVDEKLELNYFEACARIQPDLLMPCVPGAVHETYVRAVERENPIICKSISQKTARARRS